MYLKAKIGKQDLVNPPRIQNLLGPAALKEAAMGRARDTSEGIPKVTYAIPVILRPNKSNPQEMCASFTFQLRI